MKFADVAIFLFHQKGVYTSVPLSVLLHVQKSQPFYYGRNADGLSILLCLSRVYIGHHTVERLFSFVLSLMFVIVFVERL